MPKKAASTALGSTVMTMEPDDPFCNTRRGRERERERESGRERVEQVERRERQMEEGEGEKC